MGQRPNDLGQHLFGSAVAEGAAAPHAPPPRAEESAAEAPQASYSLAGTDQNAGQHAGDAHPARAAVDPASYRPPVADFLAVADRSERRAARGVSTARPKNGRPTKASRAAPGSRDSDPAVAAKRARLSANAARSRAKREARIAAEAVQRAAAEAKRRAAAATAAAASRDALALSAPASYRAADTRAKARTCTVAFALGVALGVSVAVILATTGCASVAVSEARCAPYPTAGTGGKSDAARNAAATLDTASDGAATVRTTRDRTGSVQGIATAKSEKEKALYESDHEPQDHHQRRR